MQTPLFIIMTALKTNSYKKFVPKTLWNTKWPSWRTLLADTPLTARVSSSFRTETVGILKTFKEEALQADIYH